MIQKILFASLLGGTTILSGCASQAVTNENLMQNTAFAIGLDKKDFTIYDRTDSGVKTSYSVKTKSGNQYNCYVTGGFGITGRAVSDAMCNKKGEPAKNQLLERAKKL
jgi:hypothetical protein